MKNFSFDYDINEIPFNEVVKINGVKMIRCIYCGEIHILGEVCECNYDEKN